MRGGRRGDSGWDLFSRIRFDRKISGVGKGRGGEVFYIGWFGSGGRWVSF